jgi:IS605 OrfB family transposase
VLKTWKVNLKGLSVEEYKYLREMCHLSKNVYNESVYNIRQHYFTEGTYLRYEANFGLMRTSINYIRLGSNISQQSMRAADQSFKSFFTLLKKSKQGVYSNWKVRLPHYLPKDALYPIVFVHVTGSYIKDGRFQIPISRSLKEDYPNLKIMLNLPEYLKDKKLHQIQIIPKYKGKHFEVRYIFDDDDIKKTQLDSAKALGIDLGVDNFATCATSEGQSFIIDGKHIKSTNQWYNNQLARLSSIKDHQKIKSYTAKQYTIATKRDRRIQDFIYCSTKYIVQYCVDHQIGNIVVGYNDGFQDSTNLGKVNNQQFVMLPYGKFKNRLQYLCNLYGITYIEQEESYTSKANFWGQDDIPVWNPLNPKQGNFTGKRIHRGLYKTDDGRTLNADVNGALNILRKSRVVSLEGLYSRGEVDTPIRIRLSRSSGGNLKNKLLMKGAV